MKLSIIAALAAAIGKKSVSSVKSVVVSILTKVEYIICFLEVRGERCEVRGKTFDHLSVRSPFGVAHMYPEMASLGISFQEQLVELEIIPYEIKILACPLFGGCIKVGSLAQTVL